MNATANIPLRHQLDKAEQGLLLPLLWWLPVESRTNPHNSGFKNFRMSESSRPVTTMLILSRGARLTKSQDGGILLDLDHGVFFNLNPVGARIVELLQRGCDHSSLARVIGREFHASAEIVNRDVDDFLSSLRNLGLLDGSRTVSDPDKCDA